MELIDWPGVARNTLWIIGLSIALAAWSHLRWWAHRRQIKVRHALESPRFQIPFNIGLILFCISLAWSATRWWERGLWILLGAAFTWQIIMGLLLVRRDGWDAAPTHPSAAAAATDPSDSIS